MFTFQCCLFSFICFCVTFCLGLFGFKDHVLFYKVDCKNLFILPYLWGYTIFCEKSIDYPYYGIYVFCGPQGSGKTLSMVRLSYIIQKKYKNVVMRSNFSLPYTQYIKNFEDIFPLKRACVCIDELGLIANNSKSKDFSEPILKITAQNRKNRRLILTTAQQYYQCNKSIRTQSTYIIDCYCLCKRLFINKYYRPVVDNDGNISKTIPDKVDWFVATDKLFSLYDTMEVIE